MTYSEAAAVEILAKPEVEDPTTKYLNVALQAREDCQILNELNILRSKGWRSGVIQKHFEHQRTWADHHKPYDTDSFWADRMYKSMHQMNEATQFVRAKRFLDIGCCPGGYSTYVLRACPEATGMGISLPVRDGGHGPAIPEEYRRRIELKSQDITSYDLAQSVAKPYAPASLALERMPFKRNTFDFVMCDAHHLRLNPDNKCRPWNWTRLLVSQLLLGLKAVGEAGTMLIKLGHVERPLTARILLALCRIANHVWTVKSRLIHAYRGAFYVVVRGVRTGSGEYDAFVRGLERMWYVMTFEGRDGLGRDITWAEQDYVTAWTEVMSPSGLARMVRLGTRVWQIQRDALEEFLRWKGVEVNQGVATAVAGA